MPLTTIKTHGIADQAVTVPKLAKGVTTISSTSHTLSVSDANILLAFDNASEITLTVPADSTEAIDIGTFFQIAQIGTGALTVSGETGVGVDTIGTATKTAGQYAVASLIKRAADSWLMAGAVEGTGSGGVTTVNVRLFGAGGGGGGSVGVGSDASSGGILAFDGDFTVGTVLEVVVGGGGSGGLTNGSGGAGGSNGGGNGANNTGDRNQAGGGGGGWTGVRVQGSSTWLAVAGGGSGGPATGSTSSGGRSPTAGASLTGNSTTTGMDGGDAPEVSLGSGGAGGGGGGNPGGNPNSGGDASLDTTSHNIVRATTVESGMGNKSGGNGGNSGNGASGQDGAVEILDGSGSTTYSTPGTHTHTVI